MVPAPPICEQTVEPPYAEMKIVGDKVPFMEILPPDPGPPFWANPPFCLEKK
jgi:hypothetical protein